MHRNAKGLALVVVVIAVIAGAYYSMEVKSNIGAALTPPTNSGTLNLFVSDAPANNVSAVYMTFTNISLYENFKGWTNYTLGKETINVLNLNASNAALLAGLKLGPQEFTAVGLYVTNVVVTMNGVNETFKLASHKAFLSHTFSVVTNKTTNVNIQFDLGSDLNLNSKIFTPNVGTSFTTGTPGKNSNGTFNLYVSDAPPSSYNVTAVYVTFSNLSLQGEQTGWMNFSLPNTTINLMNITSSNASLLSNLTISQQEYTMIRLYIQNVTVTVNGVNETFKLSAPFAFINHSFNVSANNTTVVHMEFNLSNDVHANSKQFTPNIGSTISMKKD